MTQKLLAAVSKDRKIIANTFSNNQLFDQCHQTRVHSLGNDKISIQSETGNSATTQ